MNEWESLSDWYDGKQGDGGDFWHGELIDPVLMRVMGDCRGLRVLDLGCGNGYLSRRVARSGAEVTGVDSSRKMIRNAKAHDPKNSLKIRYVLTGAERMKGIRGGSFDLVFANMSLMDIEDGGGAIAEVGRVLKKGGRFVASIAHPCFDIEDNSGWMMEKPAMKPPRVYRMVRSYRQTFTERVPWNVGGKMEYTRAFHRPLSWYASTISSNGMAITALEEPQGSAKFLEREGEKSGEISRMGFLEVPLHLVIEARKL
jgi:ubiquinone/menaquinone biosynthesis C-methylase UbiE